MDMQALKELFARIDEVTLVDHSAAELDELVAKRREERAARRKGES